METQKTISVYCDQGDQGAVIEFDQRLTDFSERLANENWEEGFHFNYARETVETLRRLLEVNDYSPDKMRAEKPLKSAVLKQNLNIESYEIMKQYELGDPVDAEGRRAVNQEKVDRLRPLLALCFEYEIVRVRDLCLAVLAIPIYIGRTQETLQAFNKRWKLEDVYQVQTDKRFRKIVSGPDKAQFEKLYQQVKNNLSDGLLKEEGQQNGQQEEVEAIENEADADAVENNSDEDDIQADD